MKVLNFPPIDSKIRQKPRGDEVFDPVRKKWLLLTEEEWVRQHLIHYLHTVKGYPLSLMTVEKSIQVNGRSLRYDLVVFNRMGKPGLLVECKAPDIPISASTFDQAAKYNMALQVPYLMVTNGMVHYCCQIDFVNQQYFFLPEIPDRSWI